jgi:type I restriction enzyme, S subunit
LRDCDPNYLKYSLLDSNAQEQMKLYASGAAQPKLGIYKVESIEIPFPPFPTQCKISAFLSSYDDLLENNIRRIKILEAMAQTIYHEWFVHYRFPGHENVNIVDSGTELGKVPEGWEIGKLEDALILQRGFDLPIQDRQDGDIPVYAATGITGTHNIARVKAPGIVTGRSGSLGTVIYVDEDFWPLNTTLWVKEFRRVTPIFAFYLLIGMALEQYNSGVAVPTLNRNDIHGMPIIIPPQYILEYFDDIVLPTHNLKKHLLAKNIILQTTRDLLLHKLISGELDVSKLEIIGVG